MNNNSINKSFLTNFNPIDEFKRLGNITQSE